MIISQINRHLARQSAGNTLIAQIERLISVQDRWTLEDFLSPNRRHVYSLNYSQLNVMFQVFKKNPVRTSTQRSNSQIRQRYRNGNPPILDNVQLKEPWRAAITGYLSLQQKHLENAVQAFKQIPNSSAADELVALSTALSRLFLEENLAFANPPVVLKCPTTAKRKESWVLVTGLNEVQQQAWLYRRCQDFSWRATLMDETRLKFNEFNTVHNTYIEGNVIEQIIQEWPSQLKVWFQDQNTLSPNQVIDPFIYTEPLYYGKPFVGRKNEMYQLVEHNRENNTYPILLHGIPRIGKKSLLYKFIRSTKRKIVLLPIEAQSIVLGTKLEHSFAVEVLRRMALAFGEQISNPIELLKKLGTSPLANLRAQILDRCSQRPDTLFILAINEFTELIISQHRSSQFQLSSNIYLRDIMQLLWQLSQEISNFNLIFITSEILDRLWDKPFWRDLEVLQLTQHVLIPNLDLNSTRQLLGPPISPFSIRYSQDLQERVFDYTEGHPFLTQLIGSKLLQRFNQQIANRQRVNPLFIVDDFETIKKDLELSPACRLFINSLEKYGYLSQVKLK